MHIPEGLLNGKCDSGLTKLEAAEKHKDRLRVDVQVGTADDPRLVYGKYRVSSGNLVTSSSGTEPQNRSSFLKSSNPNGNHNRLSWNIF